MFGLKIVSKKKLSYLIHDRDALLASVNNLSSVVDRLECRESDLCLEVTRLKYDLSELTYDLTVEKQKNGSLPVKRDFIHRDFMEKENIHMRDLPKDLYDRVEKFNKAASSSKSNAKILELNKVSGEITSELISRNIV